MQLQFSLDKNDYVTHQLFVASRSPNTLKSRKRSKTAVPIIYLILGTCMILFKDTVLGILFIITGILWYFLFPRYESKRIEKRFNAFVQENFRGRFGLSSTLIFDENKIIEKDGTSEGSIQLTELLEVCEIPGYFYLMFRSGVCSIIPKQKIDQSADLRDMLKQMCSDRKLLYTYLPDWKWQ